MTCGGATRHKVGEQGRVVGVVKDHQPRLRSLPRQMCLDLASHTLRWRVVIDPGQLEHVARQCPKALVERCRGLGHDPHQATGVVSACERTESVLARERCFPVPGLAADGDDAGGKRAVGAGVRWPQGARKVGHLRVAAGEERVVG